jgi:2-aminoadipate transaminase
VLVNPGDRVAVESPSYLAALQVFAGYQARFTTVPSDDEGMQVDALEALHRRAPLRLVYLVPNFQNPKGTTLSPARRHALVDFARRHGVAILEDDPYGELRYEGQALPPLAALDDAGMVVYLSTFSKTLSPGLRLAWATGPAEVIHAMTVAKQAADLHTASLTQRAVAALLETFDYEAHLAELRRVYGARRDAMLDSLARHMPSGTRWTRPAGGLFTWVELPGHLAAEDLFDAALAEQVAFVPGSPFFADHPRHDTLRLNFSNRSEAHIDEGMARLGRVAAQALAALPPADPVARH